MEAVEALAGRLEARLRGAGPHVVGISGPVAVGKSTVSRALLEAFAGRGRRTAVLGTDAFLLPNATLAQRGIEMRKGFPESFDADAIAQALDAVRAARFPVEVPVYSHETYDVVAGAVATINELDLLLVEGVNALQPPVLDRLDAAVYVDAVHDDVRAWFVARLAAFVAAARDDERSFYRRFTSMGDGEVRAFAASVWESINLPNLRDHIEPSRANATFVVHKLADHSIGAVDER